WIALTLAATWGGYSFMRKKSPLSSLTGLTVETLLIFPFGLAYLLWRHHTGAGAFGRADLLTHAFLIGTGVVTGVPLLLFAFAAQRIRLSTLGLLQYIAPTVQFMIGLWVYPDPEPFSRERAVRFGFI